MNGVNIRIFCLEVIMYVNKRNTSMLYIASNLKIYYPENNVIFLHFRVELDKD